ncbi:MAG: ABC transporter permease [Phycisphaerae bacterium]
MKGMNKVVDIVRLGLTSLTVHKVRSALTALGIIIGVCGVMSSLAINEGMIEQSQQAFKERGTDNIIVNSKKPAAEDTTKAMDFLNVYGLTKADVARLSSNVPRVNRCVTVHRTRKYSMAGDKQPNVYVIGTEPDFEKVARVELTAGRFINQLDMLKELPVCIVTDELADKLFGFEDPLGRTIRLGELGDPFVVVGVLARLPVTLAGESGDITNCVIIPLSTDRRVFGEISMMRTQGARIQEKVYASQVILQMADEQAVLEGSEVARSLLARYHEQLDFEVTVPLEQIQQMKEQKRMMTLVSLGIAAISLVVGGIGIMNIMLASVTERTREIGIRRALGGKRRDIVTQFLVESVALTMAGGIIGIVVGLIISYSMEKLLAVLTIVTPAAIVFPFIMAVAVGLISGLYPAMRAARLDPITALRHE